MATNIRNANKKKKRKVKKRCPLGLRIARDILLGILAVIVIVLFAGLGAYKGMAAGTPEYDSINVMPTLYPSKIVDRDGNSIIELASSGAKRVDVKYEELPECVKWAFIDIEDNRFYEHNGVDTKGMLRAVWNFIKKGKQEGASTLTQQLIKNNVFNTALGEHSKGATLKRKVQEQILAVELEKHMSKNDILVAYLNTINLGGGNYGIVTAAEYYFGKNVSELTASEAAVIAGITKNPTGYNPVNHPEANKERRQAVLDAMLRYGHLTQAEYDEAIADDVYSRISAHAIGKSEDGKYSYFVDAVIEDLIDEFQSELDYTYQQAYNAVFNGGLTIYTTQDSEIQAIADEEINNDENYPGEITYAISWDLSVEHADGQMEYFNQTDITQYHKKVLGDEDYKLNFWSKEDAQAAVDEYKEYLLKSDDTITYEELLYTVQPQMSFTVMDYTTGEVLAIVGGRGEKEKNMSLNRATDSLRQPGSCFKPLAAYAPAMEELGYTLGTAIDDSPFHYGGSIDRDVSNWWGDYYRGLSTVRDGIRDSMNVLAVKTMYMVGGATSVQYLENFGITSIDEEQDSGVATALGGITYGVSNIQLNAAYATIANGGEYNEPILYTKVLNRDGSVFYDKTETQEKHRVLRETVAWLLTDAMEDVITSGTGTAAGIEGTPVSGKTGTTSNTIDLWFAGYVPNGLCAAVWTGYDENVEITTEEIYHETMYSKIMSRVLEVKGLQGGEFEAPDGIVEAAVCTKSGKIPTDLCEKDGCARWEYFESDHVPTGECDTHYTVEVCSETHLLPTSKCKTTTMICIKRPMDVTGSEPKGTTADSAKSPPTKTCDGKHIEEETTTAKKEEDTKETEEETRETEFPTKELPTD